MTAAGDSIDYWRKFFRSANCTDIFEVIERAIQVAARDCPDEFAGRRDRIAETLFTCRLERCGGCDRVELPPPPDGPLEDDGSDAVAADEAEEKEGKMNSLCYDDPAGETFSADERDRNPSNYSYDEAQALTDEIDEENQTVAEVLRIKEILANQEDESEKVLFESLRRLQLMELSVVTLQATEIGRAVNGLKRHSSKQIRQLMRTLIEGWKVIVDEWMKASSVADTPPDSINPSVISEEDGLRFPVSDEFPPLDQFPPLDEGAILATKTATYEFSKFFDGMDEDGNPRNTVEAEKKNERRPQLEKSNHVRNQRVIYPEDQGQMRKQEIVTRQPECRPTKDQGNLNRQNKPVVTDLGHGRPSKLVNDQKSSGDMKSHYKQDQANIPKKLSTTAPNSDETSIKAKLEIAKRKLSEGYRQAENAKKQRTIQVMEISDLPKQAQAQRHPNVKPRNHIRNMFYGRR